MKHGRRVFLGAGALGALGAAAAGGAACWSAEQDQQAAAPSSGKLTALLHAPGQERALLPGGWLVGKVGLAVIEPFFALPHYAQKHTLADMKAANPDCTFLAYVNGAIVREHAHDLGPFETTVDRGEAERNGWVSSRNGAAVAYPDYPGALVADLTSGGYRKAFAQLCQNILSTAARSSHGAPEARFDGLFFDDTNMTPQHGLDGLGGFGPYASNAAYGEAMVDFAGDMVQRIRRVRPEARVVCNIGADSWHEENVDRAMGLAGKQFEGGALLDGFLREFSTAWTPGVDVRQPGVPEVRATMEFGRRLQEVGVKLYLNDYAPPASNRWAGPTSAEQADWDRRQRLLGGLALAMGPDATRGAVVTVPFGRSRGERGGSGQTLADPVGSLSGTIMQRLVEGDPNNLPVEAASVEGEVISRRLRSGTVHLNLGYADAVVAGRRVPARDAVLA